MHSFDPSCGPEAQLGEDHQALSISGLGKRIINNYFSKMMYHETATIEDGDIVALHDMRVASRRLRVALNVFGKSMGFRIPGEIRKTIREIARELGAVRDFDVLILSFEKDIEKCHRNKSSALCVFKEYCMSQREVLRKDLTNYVGQDPYQQFKAFFIRFRDFKISEVRPEYYPSIVESFARNAILEKSLGLISPEDLTHDTPAQELHRLRISVKRLRYTAEIFMTSLEFDLGSYINRLKLIQDHLGVIQDITFLLRCCEKFINSDIFTNETEEISQEVVKNTLKQYMEQKKGYLGKLKNQFLLAYRNSHLDELEF